MLPCEVMSRHINERLKVALTLHQQGQLQSAETIYKEILHLQPRNFDALQLLATIAAQRKQSALAVEIFDRALQIQPNHADALCNRGNALRELRRYGDALDSYDRALKIRPDFPQAQNNRGNALRSLRRLEEALASYNQAIRLKPNYAEALCNLGVILSEMSRYTEALESFDKALRLQSRYVEALFCRAGTLRSLNRLTEALEDYDLAIRIKPDYVEALYNRGNLLRELKRDAEAISSYDCMLAIKPDHTEALNNRGELLRELHRWNESLQSFDLALKHDINNYQAFNNRGNLLSDLGHDQAALASFDGALAIRPDYVDALINRGNVLRKLKRHQEALDSYAAVIHCQPDCIEALNNLGIVLGEMGRKPEAMEQFDRALKVDPKFTDALVNRASLLCELFRHDDALVDYDCALKSNSKYAFLNGRWLHTKLTVCDWTDLPVQIDTLATQIMDSQNASPPFPVLAISGSRTLQKKSAEIWVAQNYPPRTNLPDPTIRAEHAKIRIAYLSADFHNHATAYLMAGLFEQHDRSKFELIALSFGSSVQDEMRKRVAASFDQFIDVANMPDVDVAMLARNLEIDIAVDLKGFTQNCRPGIFSMRAAPLQVSYLGYPGTMGASYIDYLIADPILIPVSHQADYTEKIAYLPNCYQANDRHRLIAEQSLSRAAFGLPETGFVFCCFNNNYKITPATFDQWMRILLKVSASVLWLMEDNSAAAENLRKQAKIRGVCTSRLVFAKRLPHPQHLARHRLAGLFLDTLPYNAHTTASDALWAGLPVLTCIGETFAGRVAASLLNAIGLPELVVTSPDAYEKLAIELATNPTKLHLLQAKLAANQLTTPLFDTGQFSADLEAIYTRIYARHRSGIPPDHVILKHSPE